MDLLGQLALSIMLRCISFSKTKKLSLSNSGKTYNYTIFVSLFDDLCRFLSFLVELLWGKERWVKKWHYWI